VAHTVVTRSSQFTASIAVHHSLVNILSVKNIYESDNVLAPPWRRGPIQWTIVLQAQDIGDCEDSLSQSLSETCIVGASAQEANDVESSSETETCLLDVLLQGTPSQSGNGRHSSCTGLKIDHVAPRTMEQEALAKAYGAWPACLTSWACLMFRNALASQPL
jgi:hypothetical protein